MTIVEKRSDCKYVFMNSTIETANTLNFTKKFRIPVVLVGNKQDLEANKICDSMVEYLIASHSQNFLIKHMKCSAKNGEGIEPIFKKLVKIIENQHHLCPLTDTDFMTPDRTHSKIESKRKTLVKSNISKGQVNPQ